MKRSILVLPLACVLAGCTVGSTAQGQKTLADLTTIANTASADLASMIAIANAATPPDAAGVTCAQAIQTVGTAMQKVLSATPAGSTVGAFSAAEVASLYQPGSAQFNFAVTTIEAGCIAKLHAINQAAQSTAGLPAALIAGLGIAALPAGA